MRVATITACLLVSGCGGPKLVGDVDGQGGTKDPGAEPSTTGDTIDPSDETSAHPSESATAETGETEPDIPIYVDVAVGYTHTCALDSRGRVHCWGQDREGETMPPDERFTHVNAGHDWSCGITENREVRCWGAPPAHAYQPRLDAEIVNFEAGSRHFCVLYDDGDVDCWGEAEDNGGELLDPLNDGSYVALSSHTGHNCALDRDGRPHCWGSAFWEEHAKGYPPQTGGFYTLDTGGTGDCALRNDGEFVCWGNPRIFYVLIDHLPKQAEGLERIDLNEFFGCGLFENGHATCWTDPENGELYQIPAGRYTMLDVGIMHGCAVTTDQRICCWGNGPGAQYPPPGQDTVCPVADPPP